MNIQVNVDTMWFRPYGFEMIEDMYIFRLTIDNKSFEFAWDEDTQLFANVCEMREAIPYEKNRIFKDCNGFFYCEKRDTPVNWVDSIEELCDLYLTQEEKEKVITKWKDYILNKI